MYPDQSLQPLISRDSRTRPDNRLGAGPMGSNGLPEKLQECCSDQVSKRKTKRMSTKENPAVGELGFAGLNDERHGKQEQQNL